MAATDKNINYRYMVIVIARSDFDNSETGSVTIKFVRREDAEAFANNAKAVITNEVNAPLNEQFYYMLNTYLCGNGRKTITQNWCLTETSDWQSLYNLDDTFGSDRYYKVIKKY